MILIANPSGRGKKRIIRTFNLRLLAFKTSFVSIKNPDELCMARALVTGMAYYNRKKSQAKDTICSRYKKCLKCDKEYDLKTMFS